MGRNDMFITNGAVYVEIGMILVIAMIFTLWLVWKFWLRWCQDNPLDHYLGSHEHCDIISCEETQKLYEEIEKLPPPTGDGNMIRSVRNLMVPGDEEVDADNLAIAMELCEDSYTQKDWDEYFAPVDRRNKK